jgi:Bacteriophage tail sheath protein
MTTHRNPDVYVEETSAVPPSVTEVGTAIPVFIGYTERAADPANGRNLLMVPTRIRSMKEYENAFGSASTEPIVITVDEDAATHVLSVRSLSVPAPSFLLYYAVRLFFDNGGSQCVIVSTGSYGDRITLDAGGTKGLQAGLNAVAREDEPTLIVIPDAVKLPTADYSQLVQTVLLQCERLRDRFGIFDVHGGGTPLTRGELATQRGLFGTTGLKYGAAYYPFVRTTLPPAVNAGETNVNVTVGANRAADLGTLRASNTRLYTFVKARLNEQRLVLPPSGAIAGVYAAVDAARGVWKAPANVPLADVVEPAVTIDNHQQDDLNVDTTSGKSINAIRAIAGKGTLVWGARTLAGNDNEWRYISVRRFFNMVEESTTKSTRFAVFEPNDAHTWAKVRGMIENYLTDTWRRGALVGATTREAFFVRCGLGTTMNEQDILEGRLIVEIGMAVVRPAEFIILRFAHTLQTS